MYAKANKTVCELLISEMLVRSDIFKIKETKLMKGGLKDQQDTKFMRMEEPEPKRVEESEPRHGQDVITVGIEKARTNRADVPRLVCCTFCIKRGREC